MKEIVLEEQDARDLMTCLSAINVSTSLLYHTEGEENLSLEEAEEFYKGVFSVGVEAKASLIELKHHLIEGSKVFSKDLMEKYNIPYYFYFKDGKVSFESI